MGRWSIPTFGVKLDGISRERCHLSQANYVKLRLREDSTHTRFRQTQKKQWDAFVARLTAGKSVAMLPYYAGKKSSELLPPMSTVRSASAMRSTATPM